jgi:hypothetical protein
MLPFGFKQSEKGFVYGGPSGGFVTAQYARQVSGHESLYGPVVGAGVVMFVMGPRQQWARSVGEV